jgi:hypothetical protein
MTGYSGEKIIVEGIFSMKRVGEEIQMLPFLVPKQFPIFD